MGSFDAKGRSAIAAEGFEYALRCASCCVRFSRVVDLVLSLTRLILLLDRAPLNHVCACSCGLASQGLEE